MSDIYEISAQARADVGKGASRRLRHANKVPAILYGADKEAESITICHNELIKSLRHESFYSHVLTINVDGKKQQAILKDLHRHPFKKLVMHADFLRVAADKPVTVHVPIHVLGEDVAPGVKLQGGMVSHLRNELEITCLPSDLPEYVEVDISELEAGQSVHMSDIKLPAKTEIHGLVAKSENDHAVITIQTARGGNDDADASSEGEEASSEEKKD